MEHKHTPGEWLVNGGDDVWIGNRICVHIGNEDDARLIAAAPDLLESLQAVVRVADRSTVEFDAARAAIAKATQP